MDRDNQGKQETARNKKSETSRNKTWSPPRGIRFTYYANRPRPYGVQWRVDGKAKTKTFPTREQQGEFARDLARSVSASGVDAYRLNESEARTWRAFLAELKGADLSDVLACWKRYGRPSAPLPIHAAIAAYTEAKTAEGVSVPTLAHYRPIFARFCEFYGERDARTIERDEIAGWLAGLSLAPDTLRSHHKRVQSLFSWLKANRLIHENPCDGMRPIKITSGEVAILTVDQTRDLFAKNKQEPAELCGRLALEAFCGLRFDTARQIEAREIEFASKGLAIPAAKMKTRRPQFIDGLPANLWAWLEWSKPAEWGMNPRSYLKAKSLAFVRAGIPHPHNCLRHSFATYHVAANKDVSRTATILCHGSPQMLFSHYKGRATEADGAAYFEILP